MKSLLQNKLVLAVALGAIAIASALVLTRGSTSTAGDSSAPAMSDSSIHSQYAGQETRPIKSLSAEDIEGLKNGAGTPLGGLAKLAELNGYPGPRHVLDAIESGELRASPEQKTEILNAYNAMKAEAVPLGERLLAVEQELNDAFAGKTITDETLKNRVAESARIHGELRYVHLKHHLSMMSVLSADQVSSYNTLRGYATTADPCQNVPAGHDPGLWRLHNNCP